MINLSTNLPSLQHFPWRPFGSIFSWWLFYNNNSLTHKDCLVVFCGISTLMGYLMPNHILCIYHIYMICKQIVYRYVTLFLKETKLICLHTIERFQVLLSNSSCFICTKLNGFKYCYVLLIIQFNITNLFEQLNGFKFRKWLHVSIWPINRYCQSGSEWT